MGVAPAKRAGASNRKMTKLYLIFVAPKTLHFFEKTVEGTVNKNALKLVLGVDK